MALIGSIGSGTTAGEKDYSSFIEKAVQAKSKPIEALKAQQESYRKKSMLLREIKADLTQIQGLTKRLYGLNNVMEQLNCKSSDPQSLQAIASKRANPGTYSLQVLSLAKGQKICTDPLDEDQILPAGEFTLLVGEESFSYYFLGGTIQDLAVCINAMREKNLLFFEVIRVQAKSFVGMLTSTKTGEKNSITLENDDQKVLSSIGLFSGNKEQLVHLFPKPVNLVEIETRDSEKRIPIEPGVKIDPRHSLRIVFSGILGETIPFRWILSGKDVLSEILMEIPLASSVAVEGSVTNRQVQIELAKYFPTPADVETVYIRGEEGIFHNVCLQVPGDDHWNQPKKIVVPSADAKILYNDLCIQREQNEIEDIIPFVSVSLKGVSPVPVELQVEANKEGAMEVFVEFLYAYNQLVEKINLITSTVPLEQAEAEWNLKEEQKEKFAILQNEDFLREILYGFYQIFSKKYQISADSKLTLITQIGVKLVFSLESLRGMDNGKVEFDPKIYTEKYQENVGEMRSFFGADLNGDKVVDSGFAYEVFQYLTKYISRNGVLDTKAANYDTLVKSVGEKVQQKQESVEEFRKKQERDFSKLEGLQKGMKDMERLLDSLSPKS